VDLDGKTLALVWDYLFRGDDMFKLLARSLESRYPGVRFVDFQSSGNIHGSNELEEVAALPKRLAEHEVDGAIVAVAA
jgi:hypothetical protein